MSTLSASGLPRDLVRQALGFLRSFARMALPERARKALGEWQDASEVLVGWIQVGAIVVFASFYAVTPKTFSPNVPFEPVPVTLVIYGLFTALRLVLAYRRLLTRSFLIASIVVDMAVLMVTIWSFHLQYQAPPALYLKAPTLMYVFILISLRALRFEPLYVIAAGATAIAGWIALVLYALVISPEGVAITRSYVAYQMSYSILIGAEIDKLLAIGMVTAILALTQIRARQVLLSSVSEKLASADLSRFLAPDVASKIRSGDGKITAGQGELRSAAILFVDLRGFTPFASAMPACHVTSFLADYHARIVPLIEARGGSIDKFLGDGILASFGAASDSATYAADALCAIEDILREDERWHAASTDMVVRPRVGASAAVGEIVFGAIGHGDRLEYTVIGEVVNYAAKLEKHSKKENARAIVSDRTMELALEQGFAASLAFDKRALRSIDGVSGLHDLFVIAKDQAGNTPTSEVP